MKRYSVDLSVISSWWHEGNTAEEMARKVGSSTQPIKTALKRLGLARPAKRRPGVGSGAKNSAWKGGRLLRNDGYVLLWRPDGRHVLEHRVVMASALGRPLTTREVVHHRDGNKSNNALENLELTNPVDHGRTHAVRGKSNARAQIQRPPCALCGIPFRGFARQRACPRCMNTDVYARWKAGEQRLARMRWQERKSACS